jgi:hypothetical protein
MSYIPTPGDVPPPPTILPVVWAQALADYRAYLATTGAPGVTIPPRYR